MTESSFAVDTIFLLQLSKAPKPGIYIIGDPNHFIVTWFAPVRFIELERVKVVRL